jgi:hypothetical protein
MPEGSESEFSSKQFVDAEEVSDRMRFENDTGHKSNQHTPAAKTHGNRTHQGEADKQNGEGNRDEDVQEARALATRMWARCILEADVLESVEVLAELL